MQPALTTLPSPDYLSAVVDFFPLPTSFLFNYPFQSEETQQWTVCGIDFLSYDVSMTR
jgi:hypothetical protein